MLKDFARRLFRVWRLFFSDPRRIPFLPREILWFEGSLRDYRTLLQERKKEEKISRAPILFQRNIKSSFDAHYVYQSNWAIRRIVSLKTEVHTDVSSNIPFVAALSAVIPVDFFEFRPPALVIPGMKVSHADILSLPFAEKSIKSLSCLHVVEHIGLGRYGDPLDPSGTENACKELGSRVAIGGFLFISLPVGIKCTYFNMHRVSAPTDLPRFLGKNFLLREFCVVTDEGQLIENTQPADFENQKYACGMYWFERVE